MGSLNSDGSLKLQLNNKRSIRHQGDFLTQATSDDATLETNATVIANSGTVRSIGEDLIGVVWQPGGTATTQGLSQAERDADNSVERQKFTANAMESGNLQHHVTRKIAGTFTSISDRQAISDSPLAQATGLAGGDALGAMQTITERKVFFVDSDRNSQAPAAWTIFDAAGNAVGADSGTTDTDVTPNEGLVGK